MKLGLRLVALIVSLVFLVSCVSHRPGVRVDAKHGEVFVPKGTNPATIHDLIETVDYLVPQVATLLGVPPDPVITVIVRSTSKFDADGMMTDGAIESGRRSAIHIGSTAASSELRPYVLSHELAHWYMQKAGWELPHLVEESLAEFVGLLYGPQGFVSLRLDEIERLGIEADPSVLTLSSKDLDSMSEADSRRTCLVAFATTRQLGFDRIIAAASKGKASVDALLAEDD